MGVCMCVEGVCVYDVSKDVCGVSEGVSATLVSRSAMILACASCCSVDTASSFTVI